MEKFSSVKFIAATMLNKSGNQLSLMMNIDTDMIIPNNFLKPSNDPDWVKIYLMKCAMIWMEMR